MKVEIRRFSPHQNAKVFAALMALFSFMFAVPAFLVFAIGAAAKSQAAPPAFLILLLPLMYFVMGYVMVAIGCAIYNFVCKYMGGIEYEVERKDA